MLFLTFVIYRLAFAKLNGANFHFCTCVAEPLYRLVLYLHCTFQYNRRRIFWDNNVVMTCLLIGVVNGHYASMSSTGSRPGYVAHLQTPYMNTADMCLELYYQLTSTAIVDKPMLGVFVFDEEGQDKKHLAYSSWDNRTAWDRLFVKLPDGVHQIVISGVRTNTSYFDMSVDDIVVQRCHIFGECSLRFNLPVAM